MLTRLNSEQIQQATVLLHKSNGEQNPERTVEHGKHWQTDKGGYMSELNIITAEFSDGCMYEETLPLYQWDYGQILQITGLDLPEAYQVHFSNQRESGTTITMIGSASGVQIPDNLLTNGGDIYAFIFLHSGDDDGETEYQIKIPVLLRPQPSNEQPTPAQQSAIDQAIVALNTAVEATEGFRDEAEGFAGTAAEKALEAHGESEDAEAWAVGQRGGVDVAVSDETYHNNSKFYSEVAEQSAASSGWINFYIDERGHLIYERTDNVDLSFSLQNGHLIVEG